MTKVKAHEATSCKQPSTRSILNHRVICTRMNEHNIIVDCNGWLIFAYGMIACEYLYHCRAAMIMHVHLHLIINTCYSKLGSE